MYSRHGFCDGSSLGACQGCMSRGMTQKNVTEVDVMDCGVVYSSSLANGHILADTESPTDHPVGKKLRTLYYFW